MQIRCDSTSHRWSHCRAHKLSPAFIEAVERCLLVFNSQPQIRPLLFSPQQNGTLSSAMKITCSCSPVFTVMAVSSRFFWTFLSLCSFWKLLGIAALTQTQDRTWTSWTLILPPSWILCPPSSRWVMRRNTTSTPTELSPASSSTSASFWLSSWTTSL